VKRIRDDKEWYDCLDLEGLRELIDCTKAERPTKKTATQLMKENGHVPSDRGVKRKEREDKDVEEKATSEDGRASKKRKVTVVGHCLDTDTSNIRAETSLFKDKEFVVLSGDSQYSKDKLERLVVQHGGTKVQNPSEKTTYIIAHDTSKCIIIDFNISALKVTNLIEAATLGRNPYGDKDIIHCSWLVDCINERSLVSLHPRYMIYTSKVTNEKFKQEMDKYLDCYSESSTRGSLQKSFEKVLEIEGKNIIPLTLSQIAVVNEKYDIVEAIATKHTFLRTVYALLVDCDSAELCAQYISLYGGKVLTGTKLSDSELKSITHVIYPDHVDDVQEEQVLRTVKRKKDPQLDRLLKLKPQVKKVKIKWVRLCAKQKKMVELTDDVLVQK
jgi:DNA ligase-4